MYAWDGKHVKTTGEIYIMKNKKDLELLGFTVIENDNDYVPTMKAIYDEMK